MQLLATNIICLCSTSDCEKLLAKTGYKKARIPHLKVGKTSFASSLSHLILLYTRCEYVRDSTE